MRRSFRHTEFGTYSYCKILPRRLCVNRVRNNRKEQPQVYLELLRGSDRSETSCRSAGNYSPATDNRSGRDVRAERCPRAGVDLVTDLRVTHRHLASLRARWRAGRSTNYRMLRDAGFIMLGGRQTVCEYAKEKGGDQHSSNKCEHTNRSHARLLEVGSMSMCCVI